MLESPQITEISMSTNDKPPKKLVEAYAAMQMYDRLDRAISEATDDELSPLAKRAHLSVPAFRWGLISISDQAKHLFKQDHSDLLDTIAQRDAARRRSKPE